MAKIEIKVLDQRLREWGLPRYAADSAAMDVFACVDERTAVLPDQHATLIPLGFAMSIGDPGLAAFLLPRSGKGHEGLVLGNLIGLIDPGYQGQVMASVWNRNPRHGKVVWIEPGDRIAQMVFLPVVRAEWEEVEEFSAVTRRGAGGFGSSGR